jgi:hypothetical protein
MPAFYVQVYQEQSDIMKPLKDLLDQANSFLDLVWSPYCLQTVRELPCMPIYCSETDESVVQIKNKRNDCSKAMEWYVLASIMTELRFFTDHCCQWSLLDHVTVQESQVSWDLLHQSHWRHYVHEQQQKLPCFMVWISYSFSFHLS